MHKKISLTKEAQSIRLTAKERDILRAEIVSYMEYHPLQMPVPTVSRRSRSFQNVTSVLGFSIRRVHVRSFIGVAAAFLMIVVPVAAENALPGDVLYPMKVRVNEEVRGQLAFSPFEKIEWQAARVERRVSEARQLAEVGKLNTETEEVLSANVREHTAKAEAQLAELRKDDNGQAAVAEVTFESALEVQSIVLGSDEANAAEKTGVRGEGESALAATVREVRSHVASSTKESSTASYEQLIAQVEENTTRIGALSDGLINTLSVDQRTQVDERIARINANIVAARTAHEEKDVNAAGSILRDTLARTQKIIAFMSSVDVRASVSLEMLIPDEVTDEERVQVLKETLAAFLDKRVIIEEGVQSLSEPAKTEMQLKLITLDEVLVNMEESLSGGDITRLHELGIEATALITTLEASLVAPVTVPVPEAPVE